MLAGMWIGVGDVLMWSAGGGVDVSWRDFGINMFTVGLGNLVVGGVVIGLAYAFVAGRTDAPAREDVVA